MKTQFIFFGLIQLLFFATAVGQHSTVDFEARKAVRTGTISLAGTLETVMPLFDPVNERKWLPYWEIIVIHQDTPGLVEPGMIFKTTYDDRERIWTLLDYSPEQKKIKYHYIYPEHFIAQIDIWFDNKSSSATDVTVTYTLNAITEAGNEKVDEVTEQQMAEAFQHWEVALNEYLAAN